MTDFLTSLTELAERVIGKGFEGRTPYTSDEFAAVWQKSGDRARLPQEIEKFNGQHPIGGSSLDEFQHSRKSLQPRSQYVEASTFDCLNVEQQKRLTIGVELAAKTALLLFLDEPPSA
ncbi:MAG: hypothetical protein L6R39_004863 [Caloplaca ligustica]|nr:MAG: hypothetical protein L6R39_004863 [Caloplaca ligustica]